MRGLASSTCLLFHIAILAVFSSVSGEKPFCHDLDENGDVLDQMKNCQGPMFKFKSSPDNVFNLSELDQATADKILYKATMEDGKPDRTQTKSIYGHVTIINSQLENLVLETEVFGDPQKINIIGNMKLEHLQLKIPPKIKASLTLKGNKKLLMRSIRSIKEIGNIDRGTSKIQEYHECSFNGQAIANLADLEGCQIIDGNLIINENTKIPSPGPVIHIVEFANGCVKIENSALKDSHFLDDLFKNQMTCTTGKHVIKNNKDLCLSSEQREKWIAAGFELVYTGTCPDRCMVDYAMKYKDATKAACDIVVGDVKITGDHRRRRQSGTPPKLAHWDRVKELEGTLEISGTALQDITIFNNLEKITNPSPEKIALTVIKNPKMVKFDLPNLKNITMPSNTWSDPIFFQDNGNFTFHYTEGDRWERIAGRSHLMIPVERAPTTIGPPMTPGTTTLSPRQRENKEIEEHNERVKNTQGWITFGAAVGVVLFFLGAGAIICVLLFCCSCTCSCCRYRMKEDRDLTHPATVDKYAEKPKKSDKKEDMKEEITMGIGDDCDQHKLDESTLPVVKDHGDAFGFRQLSARIQMALEAEEIPFKVTDVIKMADAPELDLQKARNLLTQAPLPKMKYHGKPFRYIEEYKILYFNPRELNREPVPYMEKYDRIAVFKCLLTRCSEFFVVNYHLLPEAIADCSGPYYTPNNSLLAEIDGPVYVIGDIHEALHVLQTILNLDLDGEGKKHKIHPMFRNRYLFLGDYLDRGEHGLEVYFLLCTAARLFPELFTVLRGNHDGWVPENHDAEPSCRINSYGNRLKADQKKVDNPYHFAECMMIDLVTKITPFLPMAAIVNGYTFTAHGGFTLAMATTKKSIRQIFEEVPVPYYDEKNHNCELAMRYFLPSFKFGKELPFPDRLFETKKEDEYTKRYNEIRKAAKQWKVEEEAYLDKKKADPETPRDPKFESRFPGLNQIMWSDPGNSLASAGNKRSVGCTFTTEQVLKMMENNKATEKTRPIVEIIRAHEVVGISHSCDHRVTTVFTNCNHVQSLANTKLEDLKCSTTLLYCAGILRINEDGTRTVILLGITTKKEGDKALANPNRKKKRVIAKESKVEKEVQPTIKGTKQRKMSASSESSSSQKKPKPRKNSQSKSSTQKSA